MAETSRSALRQAGFYLQIDDLRISLCENPTEIAIDRDGEGGHFSLEEFRDLVRLFVSERL